MALTVRSGTDPRFDMSPPFLGLHEHWFGRLWEVSQKPFLDFLEPDLPSFPNLPDGDDRKDLGEEEVEEGEEGETPRRLPPLHPGRPVDPLPEREPRVGQSRNDDDEALQPHPDEDRDRRREHPTNGIPAEPAKRQDRNGKVGQDHPPEERPEGAAPLGPEDLQPP